MKTIVTLVLLAGVLTFVECGPTWKDCGSKLGKMKDVLITGCEKVASGDPCPLKRNTNVSITIDFMTGSKAVTDLKSVVHGIVARVPVPFPVDNPDACTGCGLSCPLKPSTSYRFNTTLFVKGSYPEIKLAVEWELQDKTGTDLVCMVVLAEVEG